MNLNMKAVEIKVRLKKNHPEIHKDSKKMVGILRQIYKRNMGIVYFPFLNERFVIPLNELKEIQQ